MFNQIALAQKVAETQKGVKEIPGSVDNPKIVEYAQSCTLQAQEDETAWCSSFVNWCVLIAAILLNPYTAKNLMVKYRFETKDIDLFFKSAITLAPRLGFDAAKIQALVDTHFPVILGTRSAMARSFLNFGTRTQDPGSKAAIVVFSRGNNGYSGHVAFKVKIGLLNISCLGGNQNNQVCETGYLKGRTLGYATLPSYDIKPSTLIGA